LILNNCENLIEIVIKPYLLIAILLFFTPYFFRMKLYLNLLVFATLIFVLGQVRRIDAVNIPDNSKSKSIAELLVSSSNEQFSSCPFNNHFVFCNENNVNTVEVNFVSLKDKLSFNKNNQVLYIKYKTYFLQNILASDNCSHYKKLFYKLRILQI
jgi:hypothetical protein